MTKKTAPKRKKTVIKDLDEKRGAVKGGAVKFKAGAELAKSVEK